MPRLYVTVGLPGSGKTTLAREFYQDALIIEVDALRKMYTGKDFDGNKEPLIRELAGEVLHTTLAYAKPHNLDVVYDDVNLTPNDRAPLLSAARIYGFAPVAFLGEVSLETALKRNLARDRQVPQFMVRFMSRHYVEPTTDEGFAQIHRGELNETGHRWSIKLGEPAA